MSHSADDPGRSLVDPSGGSADFCTWRHPLAVETPVIVLETRVLLGHHLAEGMSHGALARQVGFSRRTIGRWVAAGELARDLDIDPPRYGPRPPVPAKLDPYRSSIRERLHEIQELSPVRILEEIQLAGCSGGYSQQRDYVRQVRQRGELELSRAPS